MDEYLEAKEEAEVRREYVYGEVFALAGVSMAHSIIGTNVVRLFGNAALGSGCRVHRGDMKLRVEERLFYYPDVMVVCEPPANDLYETSPCVVVEILSESTVRKDKLEKRFSYLALPSLHLYLLVDSRRRAVTGYYRNPAGWEERRFGEDEKVHMPCVNAALYLNDLYGNTALSL